MYRQILTLLALALTSNALADGKSLASTMEVYVFPKDGQSSTEQGRAEAECYEWATENTGTDPFEQSKKVDQAQDAADRQRQQAQAATQGSGAKSAVRGAAVGALIGEIADDDAGDGAGWGAAAGLMAGRSRARNTRRAADQQAERTVESAKQSSAAQIDNFKKAFSVCLEAKDYLVKY